MLNLVLTILSSTCVLLIFKSFDKYKIDSFRAIAISYIVSSILGYLLILSENKDLFGHDYYNASWFYYSLVLGALFVTVFYALSRTVKHNGVTVGSVVNKLSLVIPVCFAIIYYGDSANFVKISGIVLALMAVYFTSIKVNGVNTGPVNTKMDWKFVLFPALVFLGSGIIDTTIKYVEIRHLSPADYTVFWWFVFTSALVISWFTEVVRYPKKRNNFRVRDIAAGLVLGVPNYGSAYFLIRTLNQEGWESSMVYPVNNTSIMGLAALGAFLIFKEKLHIKNYLGLALAILSIILIGIS